MELKELVEETKAAIKEGQIAFEDYKKSNDNRLKNLEKGGPVSELKERMDKADKALENLVALQQKMTQLETAIQRSADQLDGTQKTDSEKYNAEVKEAFIRFSRKGGKGDFADQLESIKSKDEYKSLSVQNDPDGGYFVHPDMSGRIAKRVFERSPIRSVANVQAISTDALEGPIDIDDVEFAKATEKVASDNRRTPTVGMWRIPVHEKDTRPLITQKLLEDAAFDPEAWLGNKLADKMARLEGYDSLYGTGVGEMTGILVKLAGTTWGKVENIPGAVATKVTGDDLLNMQFGLKSIYRKNARYAFHRLTFREIRKLKDNEGRYLWEPSWQVGQPSQLLGYAAVEFDDMVTPNLSGVYTAGDLPVIFADFNEFYQLVDRLGISVLRDPYTQKPFVEFYTRYRVGGDVLVSEAGNRLIIS